MTTNGTRRIKDIFIFDIAVGAENGQDGYNSNDRIMTVGKAREHVGAINYHADVRTVGLIARDGEKYCIQYHVKGNMLTIPSGKVDMGEDTLTALCREVAEELDYKLDKSTLTLMDVSNRSYPAYGNVCEFVYETTQQLGDLSNPEPLKHHWIKWMTLDEILDSDIRISHMLTTALGL